MLCTHRGNLPASCSASLSLVSPPQACSSFPEPSQLYTLLLLSKFSSALVAQQQQLFPSRVLKERPMRMAPCLLPSQCSHWGHGGGRGVGCRTWGQLLSLAIEHSRIPSTALSAEGQGGREELCFPPDQIQVVPGLRLLCPTLWELGQGGWLCVTAEPQFCSLCSSASGLHRAAG